MPILLGTSGWSYDDWVGPVYPEGLPPQDRLRHYAERFPTVEVNTTFYRTPPPAMVRGWVRRTEGVPRFELTLKAPKLLTQDALAKRDAGTCAQLAAEWADLVARPLSDAGRLGALFLQLSPGVLHNERSLERIAATLAALEQYPVAVELRNKTWLDDEGRVREDAIELLDAHDAALVAVDGPSFPPVVQGHARHAYVRFHGRNADVWHRRGKVEKDASDPRMNRYDYRYSEDELRPWAKRFKELEKRTRVVRGYFNNHPNGNAVLDAQVFEGMVGRLAERSREARTARLPDV